MFGVASCAGEIRLFLCIVFFCPFWPLAVLVYSFERSVVVLRFIRGQMFECLA